MAQYEEHSTHTANPAGRGAGVHHQSTHHESTGGGTIAFIIGGLVVAVGIIAWFIFGGDVETTTVPAEGGDAAVTIEEGAPAADGTGVEGGAAMDTAPATDGAETAPATDGAETAPATDGSETAPATDGGESAPVATEEEAAPAN